MVELNGMFRLVRMVVFGVTSLFGFIEIVLGALITNFTSNRLNGFFSFAALAIATGLLTLLTLPVMLALSHVRKGAFTSMIAVEIGWTWFLWIMWLAVGGSSVNIYFLGNCSDYNVYGGQVQAVCNESKAITAFGFLSWIFMMFYCITLIALTFRQHIRGNTRVWTQDVTETDFTATGNNNTQAIYDTKGNPAFAAQYPPTQMGSPLSVAQQQQTSGSYTQPQAVYNQQAANPYPQPQVASPYAQPQATGSLTHVQGGASPYPQV